ncbi:hypothetical protein [Gloeobacter violaceus]|uniref:Gll4389 protein n=1 Tax=Gloeobacter violaceus (strain ATCC 29082 / PCC 7421) TaxID=251221 RepID=Q7ND47_GLOVI|nr:hypothetical protein [Gloeobacter violaceus]BAC92330.1 gll4389 [Gloeobacter violaceus PCC 7421]
MHLRSRRGVTLVMVLTIGLIVGTIASAALLLGAQLATGTAGRRSALEARHLAEGASELVRSKLLGDYRRAGLPRAEWLRRLLLPPDDPLSRHAANRGDPELAFYLVVSDAKVAADPGALFAEPGAIRPASQLPAEVIARVFALPAADGTAKDLEIFATAYLRGTSQTVSRTLQGLAPESFEFALLAREPNCQFCHLQIHGNVGALAHLRPGFEHKAADKSAMGDAGFDESTGEIATGPSSAWGDGNREGILEDSGRNTTDNALASRIRGNVYTNQLATNDKSDLDYGSGRATRLNGVVLESDRPGGNAGVTTRYFGPLFYLLRGEDVDRNGRLDDFPPFDLEALARTASGSVSGNVQAVAFESTYVARPVARLGPVVAGQAVLLGELPSEANGHCRSAKNPLLVQGDLFVEGDVVLRGCLQGQGQIYSARNLYVAGDLVYRNPPGNFGNYTAATDPDAAARADIAAAKDSLRLAAGGSIILGDYTERGADDAPRLYRDRAGEVHIRSRFGFTKGRTAALRILNGRLEELVAVGAGQWRTLAGQAIPAGEVTTLEAYDALVRPVVWDSTRKALRSWLSDDAYRALLGESIPGGEGSLSSWRVDVSHHRIPADGKDGPPETLLTLATSADPAKVDSARHFFAENLALSDDPASLEEAENRAKAVIAQLQSGRSGWSTDAVASLVTAGGYDRKSWMLDLVHRDPGILDPYAVVRPTQIQRVDALLYSARRIAGHINGTNFTLNGGAVAPEVAISAPGAGWLGELTTDAALKARVEAKSNQTNPLSGTSYKYGALNYDYRLRNGEAALRHVSRLNTAESIRFGSSSGGALTSKVCRNAQCN